MARFDADVAVVGAGVVGGAVAHELAVRDTATILLEAEPGVATGASGANSGILHTGFDSAPGSLETELILRAGELRPAFADALGVRVRRCGAQLRAAGAEQLEAVARLAERARGNGVAVATRDGGILEIPGESITDPAEFTRALVARAALAGAEVRLSTPVAALSRTAEGVRVELAGGGALLLRGVANCAGLHADELAPGDGFRVYPRKGEFLVFEQPAEPLERILLPVPSSAGKGVLVFPTVDGHVIAGPTARDRADKRDCSVEPDAVEQILPRARRMLPALEGAEPVAAYAGLRPAGRGANYAIAPSRELPGLVNAAAIRSTGLTAAPAIGEHVAALLGAAAGLDLGPPRPVPAPAPSAAAAPWWRAAAERSARSGAA